MISNPNTVLVDQLVAADPDFPTEPPPFAIKRYKASDPEKILDDIVRITETRITEVDARLLTRQRDGALRETHYRSLREMMRAPEVRARVLDRIKASRLREVGERLNTWAKRNKDISKQLRESSFMLGLYDDEHAQATNRQTMTFSLQDTILPSITSPYAKQQLWTDYLAAHQRAWEAATRNPIGHRIVNIIPTFVLGRGVEGVIKSERHQQAWDDFEKRNGMRARTRVILRELLIYGELFLRYFNTRNKGLLVRSLDPCTIWDIITNPDDIEDVYYYHQQYTILNVSPVADARAQVPSTLVIRQIPARDIDHFKINACSSEKRGRSQLYSVLSWLIRFKEFANDRVLLNKMRAMFALDVSVKGNQQDVDAVQQQFMEPPGAGAVLVHNEAATVEFKNANNNANEAKTDADMILQIIATGAGISEQFLGGGSESTRAGALIRTEPDVKTFETYQEIVEDILQAAWERVQDAEHLPRTKQRMEFVFPALAQEDRSAKLKDIAFMEAMDWITKARAGAMGAKEVGVTTYDFEQEQRDIKRERDGDLSPVIATGLQQLPKIQPEGSEQPGLGNDLAPGQSPTESNRDVSHLAGEMGFSPKNVSGRRAANTQATLNRSGFTRGTEKARIRTNRTSGTPLRASARPRHVWNDAARTLGLVTRLRKKQRVLESAGADTAALTRRIQDLEARAAAQRGRQESGS